MRPAYLFVMATGVLLVFGYANTGQAINKAGALAHSDGALVFQFHFGLSSEPPITGWPCGVNLGRASWLFSIQLGEIAAQSVSVLLVHLLAVKELAQKLSRHCGVVATLLKLGNEGLLPLDCDLALGYVPLG
jgi:hypothetical protein